MSTIATVIVRVSFHERTIMMVIVITAWIADEITVGN